MGNNDSIRHGRNRRHGAFRGVVILLIGVFLLLQNLHLPIPGFIVSWQMLIIAIGLFIFVASDFKNIGGFIMMCVGGVFMVKEYFFLPYNVVRFIWPVVLIVIGLVFIIFRPRQFEKKSLGDTETKIIPDVYPVDEDYINASILFSGENRLIVSKKFKGGRISAIFGGCDVNMLQADFEGAITLECNCVFGGAELVVPANWEVKIMTNSIFGGVEDKRPVELLGSNPNKVLMIKGNCIFGGIEIKSYA